MLASGSIGHRAHVPGLLWTFVRTDFKARYHGTIGGVAWALLKPIAVFLVLYSVLSLVFEMNALQLIIGLFLWEFFVEATKTGLGSLQVKGYLLTKAQCPPWVIVVSSLANALFTCSIFFVSVCAVSALFGHIPSPTNVILAIVYIGHLVFIALGMSMVMSVLFLKFRDLHQVWEVVLQAGFFVAPVIYPMEMIPEAYRPLLRLWPITPVIEMVRSVIAHQLVPSAGAHLYLFSLTALIFLGGLAVFRWQQHDAIERL